MNSEKGSWRFWTIPNLLSIFRILLIGPIIFLLLQDNRLCLNIALVLIFLGVLSDFLDGKIARKFNQISEVGKILDPVADKLAVGAVIIVLVFHRDFPIWAAALIIGRDVLILIAGLLWATRYKFVVPSNILGKWTVFFVSLMIIAYIIHIPELEKILTIVAAFFVILSGIVYLIRFIKGVKTEQAAQK
jgi:CDP-diacylglycerol--glycerol-3-phosphate 3-phosphatidyltransferase